jgi:predicted RNase H-like HicB family nuclease
VRTLRERMAASLAELVAAGDAPAPLRESEGRLGSWAADLEIVDVGAAAGDDVEKPSPETLRAIAHSTVGRYRIILESHEDGGFIAGCAEVAGVVAYGATAAEAIDRLREALTDFAYRGLDANTMPPEPLQDVETREAARRANENSRVLRSRAA